MRDDVAQRIVQENRHGYNQIAGHFVQTRQRSWPEFSVLAKYVQPGNRILDAGCGSGRLLNQLEGLHAQYVGIDASEELVRLARQEHRDATFLLGDVGKLPFYDDEFDVVFCLATLHHVPGNKLREQAVAELTRVLRPGGFLLLTNWNLWNVNWWPTLLSFSLKKILGSSDLDWLDVRKQWKRPDGTPVIERYLHAFTKGELRHIIQRHQCSVLKQYYSQRDKTVGWQTGFNLVTIARKH